MNTQVSTEVATPAPVSVEPATNASGAPQQRTIGWAVKQVLNGERVRRRGWNGAGMFLYMVLPNRTSAHGPVGIYVEMKTAQGTCVPWTCSQSDLLAVDWELAV